MALAPAGTVDAVGRQQRGAEASGGVGRVEGQVVGAGGQLERVGQRARLEVVDQPLAVGVHVDRGAGDGVQDRRRWRCRPPWRGWRAEPARRRCRRHLRRGGTCGSSSRGIPFRGGPACHPSFPVPPACLDAPPPLRRADWGRDERTGPGRRGPRPQRPPPRRPRPAAALRRRRRGAGAGGRRPHAGGVAGRGAGAAGRRPTLPRPRGARGRVEVRARRPSGSCGAGWPSSRSGSPTRCAATPRGAATLLDRGAGNIAPYAAAPPHGIDVPAWCAGPASSPRSRRPARPPRLRAAGTRPAGGGDSPA